jgi:predicted nucleic acid-binding protein
MNGLKENTRYFVVDTNLFVAAIKRLFSKSSDRTLSVETKSLGLLFKLIVTEELQLKGNSILVDEYRRLAEELDSETSRLILKQLLEKIDVIEIKDETLDRCKTFLPETEAADVVHAATCLETGAILITNDRHFDRIKESGVIKVWSISEAIRKLL